VIGAAPTNLVVHVVTDHRGFSASIGDLIAVVALALAWATFQAGTISARRGQVLATTALLRSVRESFLDQIGADYFSTVYDDTTATARAEGAAGHLDQVYVISTEPIAALIADHRAMAARLISDDTVRYGTVALWQITKFNDLVRRQSTFNAIHAPDFSPPTPNSPAVQASVALSRQLHQSGIGDAKTTWFNPLRDSIDADLKAMEDRDRCHNVLRRNRWYIAGDVLTLAAIGTVAAAYATSL
jgi:hypothetical protein